MNRGRFIVLEGIDGSGTTTAAARLEEALTAGGQRVLLTFEPSGGEIGQLIRRHLAAGREEVTPAALALLFAADRLHHLKTMVEPALARGEVVICDRYVMSSWAYQSLDCDETWVREINRHARWPDLTLIFAVSADIAFARVKARTGRGEAAPERFDVPLLQHQLAERYAAYAADQSLTNTVVIDAAAPLEDVSARVLAAVAHD